MSGGLTCKRTAGLTEAKRAKYLFRVVHGATPASGEPDFWDGEIPWATPATTASK